MASDDKNDGKSDYREWFDDPYAFDIPDATYDDLPKLVRSLKRAAIDAYVRDKLAPPPAFLTPAEDHYLITVNSGAGGGSTTRITRPNSDGEGGGEATTITTNFGQTQCDDGDFTSEFDSVREEIKKILEPWIGLPNPKRIEYEMNECREIVSILADKTSITGGKIVPSGDIQTKVQSIHGELVEMGGVTVETFKSIVIENLGKIVNNLSTATVFWGSALGSEQGIFAKARESVVSTVTQGITLFNKVAISQSGKLDTILKIAKYAMEGFKLFVGNPATKLALDSTGLSLEILDGLKDGNKTSSTANTYEEGINALITSFNTINDTIRKSENSIKNNLVANMSNMYSQKESYDLTLKATKSSEVQTKDKLHLDQSRIDNILGLSKNKIIEDLDKAWKKMENIDMTDCVDRDKRVGIGKGGPSVTFHHFKWLLHDLIKRLSEETENSFKNFELAVEYIKDEDKKSQSDLDAMENIINNPKGPDPWQKRD